MDINYHNEYESIPQSPGPLEATAIVPLAQLLLLDITSKDEHQQRPVDIRIHEPELDVRTLDQPFEFILESYYKPELYFPETKQEEDGDPEDSNEEIPDFSEAPEHSANVSNALISADAEASSLVSE